MNAMNSCKSEMADRKYIYIATPRTPYNGLDLTPSAASFPKRKGIYAHITIPVNYNLVFLKLKNIIKLRRVQCKDVCR